ncbi:MAG: lipase family protein, partial [Burkholderiaceae bacterium]|nr:lipase family protein [Burkholderiaceae bacterium]
MAFVSGNVSRWALSLALALSLSLTACGGGDPAAAGAELPPAQTAPPSGSGELQSALLLSSFTVNEIAQALDSTDTRVQGLQPVYGVRSYRLEYQTTDAQGQAVRASGLVNVPIKAPGARSPVLGYQHGTIFRDAEAPSNHAVASEVAVVLASVGYIVVAPDYVGYGVSKGRPHPYLLSAPSAAATVDFLTAAQTWRQRNQVADNGQLFLTGYSEGGYVTLAAHRALQESQSPHLQALRLVVPGAGPYNVQATLDGLVRLVRNEQALIGALINPGFLRYLGGSAQREVRRLLLRQLLPDDADVLIDTQFIDHFLADDEA